MHLLDKVQDKNMEYVHKWLYNFSVVVFNISCMPLCFYWCSAIAPLSSAATDKSFVKRSVGYVTFGKFKGFGGLKNLDKNLTPLGALRELFGDQLPKYFSIVAKATTAEKGLEDDTSPLHIGSTSLLSLVIWLYRNQLLASLHNAAQFQRAKQMYELTVNKLKTVFNCQIELLVLPGQYIVIIIKLKSQVQFTFKLSDIYNIWTLFFSFAERLPSTKVVIRAGQRLSVKNTHMESHIQTHMSTLWLLMRTSLQLNWYGQKTIVLKYEEPNKK